MRHLCLWQQNGLDNPNLTFLVGAIHSLQKNPTLSKYLKVMSNGENLNKS